MKPVPRTSPLTLLLMTALAGGILGGCAAMDVKTETMEKTRVARVGPESTPHRSITGFSGALRCMDTTFINYGVRDVSVLIEDIVDQTKKVNAGTKDMLISAVSLMTKRSQAVRLVAFGQDSSNLITFLQQAERKNAYAVTPEFDIRGAITQLDENVIQKQADAGIGYDSGGRHSLGIGYAKDAASNILALDLSMLSTEDFSVLPGVTSRNSVVIFKEGKGIDGDATISKFGINYSVSLSKAEGQTQALRNLVELAAVELFGKLTKTPFWTCLGTSADDSEIRTEIDDWYETLAAASGELVAWAQNQLRLRGYYRGPVDGESSPALLAAVAAYRKALGLEEAPLLDRDFFAAYLNADHAKVLAAHPAPPAPPIGEAGAAPVEPLSLQLLSPGGRHRYARGEPINLLLRTSRDAYVYCYLRDEQRQVQRFYPNRFSADALVMARTSLRLPGAMRFQIVANEAGVDETIACFGTERDVSTALPGIVLGADFENLPVNSLERLRDAFLHASSGALAQGYFHVDVQ
jgi:hypothetical protein